MSVDYLFVGPAGSVRVLQPPTLGFPGGGGHAGCSGLQQQGCTGIEGFPSEPEVSNATAHGTQRSIAYGMVDMPTSYGSAGSAGAPATYNSTTVACAPGGG